MRRADESFGHKTILNGRKTGHNFLLPITFIIYKNQRLMADIFIVGNHKV
jgi:hypothetical protein